MLSVLSPEPPTMSPHYQYGVDHQWSSWRTQPTHAADLPTPPSSVPPRKTKSQLAQSQLHIQSHHDHEQLTLPPISQLDRWACPSPITPPDDDMLESPMWNSSKPGPSRLHSPITADASPLLQSPSPSPSDDEDDEMEEDFADPALREAADWVTSTRKRSAHDIAEKTCEMVCYLWFSSNISSSKSSTRHRSRTTRRTGHGRVPASSPPYAPLSNDKTAALQFSASPAFVQFMQKLLETTQVSQSVIVLSLHYIYRLKEKNSFTVGRAGSEFRAAVVGFMLANKFLDDNTYTNKTWSEVSGIALEELNKMEREFLHGVDFTLYVDKATYESWLNLLTGLVLAKERECSKWQSRRGMAMMVPSQSGRRVCEREMRSKEYDGYMNQRARSSSPVHGRSSAQACPSYSFTFAVPTPVRHSQQESAQVSVADSYANAQRPGSKRSAEAAFSPTSATFANMPAKRPVSLALDIPSAVAVMNSRQVSSAHPSFAPYSESMQGFERMSLNSGSVSGPITPVDNEWNTLPLPVSRPVPVEQLTTSYRPEDSQRYPVPDALYFYKLSSSPMRHQQYDDSVDYETDAADYPERKAKLKYSRPPQHAVQAYDAHTYAHPHHSHQQKVVSSNTSGMPYSSSVVARQQARSGQTLPPLSIALSTLAPGHGYGYSVVSPRVAQSAHSSPLPSFADVYRTIPMPVSIPLPVTNSMPASSGGPASWSTDNAECVNAYQPHYSHHTAVTAPYKPTIPSPLSRQNGQEYEAHAHAVHHSQYLAPTCSAVSSHSPVESGVAAPAAFANAGPAGVSHFYALQQQQHAYAGHASSPAIMQSQSVNASPYAYAYTRGRRY